MESDNKKIVLWPSRYDCEYAILNLKRSIIPASSAKASVGSYAHPAVCTTPSRVRFSVGKG